MLEGMLYNSESSPIDMDQVKIEQALNSDRSFSISCELGSSWGKSWQHSGCVSNTVSLHAENLGKHES